MTDTPNPQSESATEFLKRLRTLAPEGDDDYLSNAVEANRLPHEGIDLSSHLDSTA